MSRALYRLLVHLHPRGFRDRFEDEMLAVYDDAVATHGGVRLVASTLVSLIGQWLRPSPSSGIAVSADTMHAFEICRSRQRLEAAVASQGLILLAALLMAFPSELTVRLFLGPLMFFAPWGMYGLARVLWQRVRSPQEYERAHPGLRSELEQKVDTHRVRPGRVWFVTAMLVAFAALFLLYPEWRHWDDPPARMFLATPLFLWHVWLQRRLVQALQRELDA